MKGWRLRLRQLELRLWSVPLLGDALQRRERRLHEKEFVYWAIEEGEWLPPDARRIRALTDRQLHRFLGEQKISPAERLALEREVRRRDAWAAPAGRAFWISVLALVVSSVALIATLADKFGPEARRAIARFLGGA